MNDHRLSIHDIVEAQKKNDRLAELEAMLRLDAVSDSPDWEYLYRMDEKRITELETVEDGVHALVERIASLEAARAETFGQFQHMAKVALEQQRRAERAEAELAALNARRCEGCAMWPTTDLGLISDVIPPDRVED